MIFVTLGLFIFGSVLIAIVFLFFKFFSMLKNDTGFIDRLNIWAKNSIGLKLFVIGVLLLILLIPSLMIQDLIYERETRSNDVYYEISSKWGSSQTLAALVWSIPYRQYNSNNTYTIKYAHFLPDTLNIEAKAEPEVRSRGIYDAVLYSSDISFKGDFPYPNILDLGIAEENVIYDEAFVSFGLTDLRGINEDLDLNFDGQSYAMEPGLQLEDLMESGLYSKVKVDPSQKKDSYSFEMNLNLNGSYLMNFVPLGKTTNVSVESTWNNPSFDGAFLPDEHELTEDGFVAKWKVLHLNRNFPQQWLGSQFKIDLTSQAPNYNYGRYDSYNNTDSIDGAVFGVKLIMPVDTYQKNTRSVKYASMAIFLTFLAFFFAEVVDKKRIHVVQYLLVGFAVIMFYLLLLSLSEHIGFGLAYLAAMVSVVAMITLYSHTLFKNKAHTAFMGLGLTILYGFFYSLLQLQDYALLIGSLGLFIILAALMYGSRKIDWYTISN